MLTYLFTKCGNLPLAGTTSVRGEAHPNHFINLQQARDVLVRPTGIARSVIA